MEMAVDTRRAREMPAGVLDSTLRVRRNTAKQSRITQCRLFFEHNAVNTGMSAAAVENW